ncbi:MAG TPA: DinB family protein [Thermoanaerobaculia bacterium]|nr:DinB family protein [Thermoanaerobaculia bacterium]
MTRARCPLTLTLILAAGLAPWPALAADPEPLPSPSSFAKAQLLYQLGETQKMMVALAEGMPDDAYNWRPNEKMRSPGEMFLHTARANFSQPESWGVKPPEELTLCGNYLDQGNLEKAKVIDMLKKSFEHARKAVDSVPGDTFFKKFKIDNRESTPYEDVLALVTRDSENLGRMISYSLLKGIVPPWMGGWFTSGS